VRVCVKKSFFFCHVTLCHTPSIPSVAKGRKKSTARVASTKKVTTKNIKKDNTKNKKDKNTKNIKTKKDNIKNKKDKNTKILQNKNKSKTKKSTEKSSKNKNKKSSKSNNNTMFSGFDDPFFRGGMGGGQQQQSGRQGQGGRNNQLANPGNMMQNPFSMMQMMGGMGSMGSMMPFGQGQDPFEGFDLMNMQGGGGQGGTFMSQSMCISSSMGEDGKMHTERFASSSVGDGGRQIHQKEQAYSNSKTGVDKMSMERQIRDKGRKMVKERTRGSQDEKQTDLFRGMNETEGDAFDQQWRQEAQPHITPLVDQQRRQQQQMQQLGRGGLEQFSRGFGGQALEDDQVMPRGNRRAQRQNNNMRALPSHPHNSRRQ